MITESDSSFGISQPVKLIRRTLIALELVQQPASDGENIKSRSLSTLSSTNILFSTNTDNLLPEPAHLSRSTRCPSPRAFSDALDLPLQRPGFQDVKFLEDSKKRGCRCIWNRKGRNLTLSDLICNSKEHHYHNLSNYNFRGNGQWQQRLQHRQRQIPQDSSDSFVGSALNKTEKITSQSISEVSSNVADEADDLAPLEAKPVTWLANSTKSPTQTLGEAREDVIEVANKSDQRVTDNQSSLPGSQTLAPLKPDEQAPAEKDPISEFGTPAQLVTNGSGYSSPPAPQVLGPTKDVNHTNPITQHPVTSIVPAPVPFNPINKINEHAVHKPNSGHVAQQKPLDEANKPLLDPPITSSDSHDPFDDTPLKEPIGNNFVPSELSPDLSKTAQPVESTESREGHSLTDPSASMPISPLRTKPDSLNFAAQASLDLDTENKGHPSHISLKTVDTGLEIPNSELAVSRDGSSSIALNSHSNSLEDSTEGTFTNTSLIITPLSKDTAVPAVNPPASAPGHLSPNQTITKLPDQHTSKISGQPNDTASQVNNLAKALGGAFSGIVGLSLLLLAGILISRHRKRQKLHLKRTQNESFFAPGSEVLTSQQPGADQASIGVYNGVQSRSPPNMSPEDPETRYSAGGTGLLNRLQGTTAHLRDSPPLPSSTNSPLLREGSVLSHNPFDDMTEVPHVIDTAKTSNPFYSEIDGEATEEVNANVMSHNQEDPFNCVTLLSGTISNPFANEMSSGSDCHQGSNSSAGDGNSQRRSRSLGGSPEDLGGISSGQEEEVRFGSSRNGTSNNSHADKPSHPAQAQTVTAVGREPTWWGE
ncbi:expressed protein [Phakopsora pachyrhizi]|uniref:Expressed protein n=1 Tax=Phakopsora pachyrhizi TaxID=170000 RepID=A0AAV0AYE4_PHAPC|nr:expressed protein [Phakopsora pachyrhizi]